VPAPPVSPVAVLLTIAAIIMMAAALTALMAYGQRRLAQGLIAETEGHLPGQA
jgi:hypothetical protein